jgi:hypothetical protein
MTSRTVTGKLTAGPEIQALLHAMPPKLRAA